MLNTRDIQLFIHNNSLPSNVISYLFFKAQACSATEVVVRRGGERYGKGDRRGCGRRVSRGARRGSLDRSRRKGVEGDECGRKGVGVREHGVLEKVVEDVLGEKVGPGDKVGVSTCWDRGLGIGLVRTGAWEGEGVAVGVRLAEVVVKKRE